MGKKLPMTINSTPEHNNDKDEKQVDRQEKIRWNSAKLLENLFDSGQSIDNELNLTKKLKQLPAEVIENFDRTLSEEEILITAVEEARRVIDCDRIIIYSIPESSQGKVIAEAVVPGWTPVLGNIIKDPYLGSKYLEKYQQGYCQAVNNIHQVDITKNEIEPLERLQIQALLIVPIWQKSKLFGLLVAHQCSGIRQWKSTEIKYLEQITTLVRVALERTQLIQEKQKLQQQAESEAQWTKFFNEAIPYIYKCFQEKDILKATVREVRRLLNCDRVVIYGLTQDRYGKVIAESVAIRWTKALGRVIHDPCFEFRYLEKYQNGRVRAIGNIYEAGLSECYLEQLEKLEVKANLVTPILNEGKIFGLLVAHQCSHPRKWEHYEIRWVTHISTQVGFALDNAQLLQQAEQSSLTADYLAHQHNEQKEVFKQQLIAILASSTNTYDRLTQDALSQSESLLEMLQQIGKINDIVKSQADDIDPVQSQKQQQNSQLQHIKKSVNL